MIKSDWDEEKILNFQMSNNRILGEINKTLIPCSGQPKVGIFLPGQSGDCGTAMSVLKYKNQLWPKKDIVWYANSHVADMLKYSLVNEVREWPWAGNGLPEGTPDFWPLLMNENNRLNKELAKQYELTADLDEGYFPAPYMLTPQQRHGIDYPNCSRKVFKVPDDYEWHPVLNFSDEEKKDATDFMTDQMPGKKIFLETFAGSGQSLLNESMIAKAMDLCNNHWGDCNYIFGSHKFFRHEEKFPAYFFQQPGFYSAAHFTVRQCALIAEQCDLMISVSSGITVAASAWGVKQPPTIQYAGSFICSTQTLANGHFELVTADNKTPEVSKKEFETKLIELLNQYK